MARFLKNLGKRIGSRLNRHVLSPMVLREWKNQGELDIIEKAIQVGYFRNWLAPRSPDLEEIRRYIIIAPHQDDEVIGCGGLMHQLTELNAQCMVIFTTNGEQNNIGVPLADSVKLRNSESEKALFDINPEIHHLGINNSNPIVTNNHIHELSVLIDQFNPDLILHPWVLDPPLKHRISNLVLYQALKSSAYSNNIWGYQVHSQLFSNIYVSIDSFIDQKTKMIQSYQTQLRNIAPYDHYALGMAIWNAKMSGNTNIKYAESFFGLEFSTFMSMMDNIIVTNISSYLKDKDTVSMIQAVLND